MRLSRYASFLEDCLLMELPVDHALGWKLRQLKYDVARLASQRIFDRADEVQDLGQLTFRILGRC